MLQMLGRRDGRIAYEVHEPAAGAPPGPTVLAVPGMGDVRGSFRHLVAPLVEAGHRVVVTDLRGHGDSSTSFDRYGDVETAGDVVALLEVVGPAVVLGSSMGAAAGVLAAAERDDLVLGLALLGPFVRDPQVGRATLWAMRVALAPAWARPVWKAYLPRLYAGRTAADHADHVRAIDEALRRPGGAHAFSRTTRSSHAPAEAVLDRVRVPTVVVMGELDPDFPSPAEEAAWVAGRLGGTVVMVPEAGHYPASQCPELVVPAVLGLLRQVAVR